MKISDILPDGRDVWDRLRETDKPIVVYGTGNGVDKLISAFVGRGIRIADFFASDGFVRERMFHGKKVLGYPAVCEKYGDFVVVVGFGSRLPDVMANVARIATERELYIPEMPVVGDGIFDKEYFLTHESEINAAREVFSDNESGRLFDDIIAYRLTGELRYLSRVTTPEEVIGRIVGAESVRRYVDLGAYDGDTIRELAAMAPGLTSVTAFEPDARSFRKLSAFAETDHPYSLETVNAAAWDADTSLDFTAEGNRNSTLVSDIGLKAGAKIRTVRCAKVDTVLGGRAVDYIKYDVEGAEAEALSGSMETVARWHPTLLVSLYHRSEDLFSLPLMVRGMGYERLYLRRYAGFPAWDLNLIAK